MDKLNCCLSCLARPDLKRCDDKLAFFENCWPSFFECASIDKLSKYELQCALCLIKIVIDAITSGEYSCSKDMTIRLYTIQTYINDTYALHEIEQQQEVLAVKCEEKREELKSGKRHLLKL